MTPYDESQVNAFESDVAAAFASVNRVLDPANVVWAARMQFDAVTMGYSAARAKQLAALRVELGITPKPSPVTRNLVSRGMFFGLDNGELFTAVECTDFGLLASYQNEGEEALRPVMEQRADCGFNLRRVWTAFDGIPGIGTFTTLDYSIIRAFMAFCARYGSYVEFTAYTGWNDPHHWQNLCEAALQCSPMPLLELVNELDQNTDEPDALGRVFQLPLFQQAPAPLLSSHGSNGSGINANPPVQPPWSYQTMHYNNATEWQRKVGHNSMEVWSGPTLANENPRYTDNTQSEPYAYDAAAGAALLCAGSCYHSVNGKASALWTPDEERCARMWAAGARSVDLRFQDGRYVNVPPTDDLLRIYQRVLPDGSAATVEIRK